MNISLNIFNSEYSGKGFKYSEICLIGFMIRKIIKQGHSTLTITLPSDWTRKFNLEAGNEIDLAEKDNGLFLSTEKNNHDKKVEIDISGMDIPTIWKYFMAVYREGYDEILVKFPSDLKLDSPYKFFTHFKLDKKYGRTREKESALEFLHQLVNRFIGFEIVNHGKDFVVMRELTEPTSKEFDISLRRVLLLIQQMAEETCEAIVKNKPGILAHIHDVDVNLDKFHDYCIRILNKLGNKDSRKTSLLFSTLYILELAGDEFKNISHHIIHDFQNVSLKNINCLAESTKQQIDLFYDLFYKFDKKKAEDMAQIDAKDYFNISQIYKKAKTEEEKEILHHLRMISRYLNAVLELRIEMEF